MTSHSTIFSMWEESKDGIYIRHRNVGGGWGWWAVDNGILVACCAGLSSGATFSCPCMMPLVHGFGLREPALVLLEIAHGLLFACRRCLGCPASLLLPC